MRLNCPEVVLFLLRQKGKKVEPPAGGMHRDWAKLDEQSTEEEEERYTLYSIQVIGTEEIKVLRCTVIATTSGETKQ